ncbi:conjugal transfer protein TrbL family protein [Brevibacillus centrosporus]|uniref:conjugal transfer protein TrbL family protein n=1 Tax=Brevibacillus centrosporus TaxID=54910 RepID=UPI003D1FBF97
MNLLPQWLRDGFLNFIPDILGKIFEFFTTGLLELGLKLIQELLFSPTSLEILPFFSEVLGYAQTLAITALGVKTMMLLVKNATDAIHGNQQTTVQQIATNAFVSALFIYAAPWVLENGLIRVNNIMVEGISDMGVNIGDGIMSDISAPFSAMFAKQLMGLIIVGALFLGGIQQGIRYVDLFVLGVFGPFMAVSKADKGEAFDVWVREAIAVVFTQSVQMLLITLAFNAAMDASILSKFASIGAIIVMLRGPQVLRQYIYKTGTGGQTANVGKSATMQLIRVAIKK